MTGRLQSIPLDNILANPRLQNRNAAAPCLQHRLPLTPATVEHLDSLTHALMRGEPLPPVKVVEADDDHPGCFWLVDGYHRLEAFKRVRQPTIPAIILQGRGFNDALVAAAQANHKHGLRLTKDQQVENAWRYLNLPESDHYRRMNKTQAEAVLGVDRETIKKMRQKVRQWGIEAGVIDPSLKGKAGDEALLVYWNQNPAPDTWRMARMGSTTERKNPHWKQKLADRMLAQTLANIEAAYGAQVAKTASNNNGFHLHNVKADEGMAAIRKAFSVYPQPLPAEDEVVMDAVDLEALREVQRQQAFDYQPQPLFNNHDHQPHSDF